MIRQVETLRLVRFLLSGGVAAAANLSSRWLLGHLVSYEAAVTAAYLVGMMTAFALMRLLVFDRSPTSKRSQLVRFGIVNATGFAQVWLTSVGLARFGFPAIGFTYHPETVAHVIGVGSPVVSSYILHKRYSFRGAGA